MKEFFINKEESPAERRRKAAEEKGELSVSHYRGNLHTHTLTQGTGPLTPEKIMETRKGSNCGKIPLALLAEEHLRNLLNEYLAITEHSRDANPKAGIEGLLSWFRKIYLKNKLKKEEKDLTKEEQEKMETEIKKYAEEVVNYGDERLKQIINDINGLATTVNDFKIFKGIEANLLPDGSFDTEMVDRGEFELVNVSIHPTSDNKKWEAIISNPEKYSELMIAGIKKPKANIFCHPGFNCKFNIKELDWEKIAEEAIKNGVAIEINIKEVMKYLYGEVSKSKDKLKEFEAELPKLVPIISKPEVREILKPYFEKGLKISINLDEHQNPFIKKRYEGDEMRGEFRKKGMRYWRAMKIIEKYFNEIFKEAGISGENIINTFPKEKLERFLSKKEK